MAVAALVREAGDRLTARHAGDGLDGDAAGNRRPSRIAPKVDMDVPALVVREEADEVAPVGLDRQAVPPLTAELGIERVRHPGRAVDLRLNSVGETLPACAPGRRAGASGRGRSEEHTSELQSLA